MTRLLVSVRNEDEAEAAIWGGADLIDIKEPTRGSLGRPDAETARRIIAQVGDRRPVSVAFGELAGESEPLPELGCRYAKWGLSRLGSERDWQKKLQDAGARLGDTGLVAVAYADWERAQAPMPEQVCSFACTQACRAFLIDTWKKDGSNLLDWLSVTQLETLVRRCREADVRVALAGSLGLDQMMALSHLEPEWFAVRGAVCKNDQRTETICRDRVSRFATFLHSGSIKTWCAS